MEDPAYEDNLNRRIGAYMVQTKKELQALAANKRLYPKSTLTKAEICSLLAKYDIELEEQERHFEERKRDQDAHDAAQQQAIADLKARSEKRQAAAEEAKKAHEERLIALEAASQAHIAFVAEARARIKGADEEIKSLHMCDVRATDDVQVLQEEIEKLRKAFNLRTRMYNTLAELVTVDEKYKRDTIQNALARVQHI